MKRTRAVLVAMALIAAFGAAAGSLPASSAPSTDDVDASALPSASGESSSEVAERPVTNPVSSATRARLLAALAALGVGAAFVVLPARRRTVALAAGVLAVGAASYAWVRPAAGGVLSAVASATATTNPVGAVLAALVVLGATALAWRYRGGARGPRDDRRRVADDDATDATGDVERTPTLDVHPATRPPSNDVVRAWQRAVERVSVPAPAARTPREFLRAVTDDDARNAPDPGAFERLTTTFERGRYGDVDPDEEAERARSLARRAVGDREETGTERDAGAESDAGTGGDLGGAGS
jgi:hypothetical protein